MVTKVGHADRKRSCVHKTRLFKCAVIFVVTSFLFLGLQLLSTFLPLKEIQNHVAQSEASFLSLNQYPHIVGKDDKYKQDLCTDSIMLNMAVPYRSLNHFDNAFNASFFSNIRNSLIPLVSRIHNWDLLNSHYLRYWNGYVVPLRVLLCIFTYQSILRINVACFAILLIIIAFLFAQRFNTLFAVFFVVILFQLGFAAVPFSMQFASVYYISFGAIIFELVFSRKCKIQDFAPELFIVIGVSTSWIDFLSAPLISLGLPLLVAFMLTQEGRLKVLVSSSFAWAFGYLFFWASRWGLALITYPQFNIFANVYKRFAFRSGETSGLSYKIEAVGKNLSMIFAVPSSFVSHRSIFSAFVLFIITLVLFIIWNAKKREPALRELMPFALVGMYPFIWYLLLANHSAHHYWFTYRSLIITLFAFVCMAYELKPFSSLSQRK